MAESSRSGFSILPTHVRVRGIAITEFLAKLTDIISVANLNEMSGFNIGLNFSGKTLSLTWKDRTSFNITSSEPEILDKVIEAIGTLFD